MFFFHVVCNRAVSDYEGLHFFKDQSADTWSYCLPKERTDSDVPETSHQ